MKYKNENGEWKDIYVKASDTLPIGTEVDYEGTDIPSGWEEVSPIIESGNHDGISYVKLYDGTLIEYFVRQITTSEPRSQGGLTYYSGSIIVDLPVSFIDTGYLVLTGINMANMNFFAQSYGSIISKNQVQIAFASTGNNEIRPIFVYMIGKWK